MSSIDGLLLGYEEFVRLPWESNLAGAQKVWFAIYEPRNERRLRFRLHDFEHATRQAGHSWMPLDITDEFGHWMGAHDYASEYFSSHDPDDFLPAVREFEEYLQDRVRTTLATAAQTGVVALVGVGSLFGITSAAALIEAVAGAIPGRLLVFFPGQYDGSVYRLLDAHDGWNYLAIPITAKEAL